MSQSNTVKNYLIHDAKGQPQMIKVVQQGSTSKNSTPVQIKQEPGIEQTSQNTIYRTVNVTGLNGTSKLVQVPIQTLAQLQKTAAESEMKKKKSTSKVVSVKKEPRSRDSSPSPISSANPARKRHDSENEPMPEYTTKRRKLADKVGKGLRHFSMKVCEKVRNKGFTSYNEVADELVAEFTANMHGSSNQQYDQKNIRRRVYDALNVLMAMNIISKEKKEIRWLGLPTNSIQECNQLEQDKQAKIDRIQQKTQQLHDLIMQQISFKSLVERNKRAEARGVKPSASSAIHLPFIVVNTSEKALIDCSISNDKTEYMFKFNKRFQIYDDIDILKRMGLLLGLDKGECTEEDLKKAKSMVPKSLEYYLDQLGHGATLKVADLLDEDNSDAELQFDEEEDDDEGSEEYLEDSEIE